MVPTFKWMNVSMNSASDIKDFPHSLRILYNTIKLVSSTHVDIRRMKIPLLKNMQENPDMQI